MFCFQDHEHATFDDILGEFELSVIPNMMMLISQTQTDRRSPWRQEEAEVFMKRQQPH